MRRRRGRAATGHLLVEGPNTVEAAHDHLLQVFVAEPLSDRVASVLTGVRAAGIGVLEVTGRALAALADAQTPQGIVGVARRPAADLTQLAGAQLLVVLDGVADPGNLGTIVRTCDAAGVDGVVLTAGSVDPTNAKAVRSSAGSLFHLPVVDGIEPDAVAEHCRRSGIRLIAAAAGAARRYDTMTYDRPAAIVFGNEAHGLSDAIRRHVEVSVSVPIMRPARPGFRGHAESLNLATATAVVLFEIARQRGTAERIGTDGSRSRQPAP